MQKFWMVYLLECKDGSYYTGITNDIENRKKSHILGKGSKYVKSRGFSKILKTRKCEDKSEALKFELKIKKLSKHEKVNWFKE